LKNASLEKRIDQLKFCDPSSKILMRVVESCPQEDCSIIPMLTNCLEHNPNLIKLCEILPSAYSTIYNYLFSSGHVDEHKEIIDNKDILLAFSGRNHHNVIVGISQILSCRDLPLIFTNPKMTKTEFQYSHLIKTMLIKEENNILVGYDAYGTKVIGLHFYGNKRSLKKIIKDKQHVAVHFGAIIDVVDSVIEKNICNMQKENRLLLSLLADMEKTIDYTIKYGEYSTLDWTKKRFKISALNR
jgi:hypothetical protein